ncbi:MAG: RpiB/LacA/LacB family sugar-phosphate isomerase [Propionibacteriaceae bacterium]|jgi:ribose 5-phosphate isomerase B|nr:RpiB/LacA/LacB family sugar-phosphate isomerase [Propionibacteriaceae bacterium]
MNKLALGNDEAAVGLRDVITEYLKDRGLEVDLYGPSSPDDKVDYPDVAVEVAKKVADGTYERAILLCGTGIGMAIAANKVPGVRAALVSDAYSAERAMASNDAHIITMGARTVGPELAKVLVRTWLDTDFAGGRSLPKVKKLEALDEK